jgi:chemotaxis protein MotB
MADFKDRGVDVEYKNGLVYVSMADNLLYKTGSAALGQNGKEALATLANVLNNYPNLKVIVVGHTDDVQTKKGTDNWSLSTERANGVVRLLTDTYNVEPSRITAAGKGKYDPVAENTSEAGRAKNRRTDIILNPDLVKVWNSVRKE